MQYAAPTNAPKKARNIRPFREANRNSPPLISYAFSAYVPGSFSGFLPPYSGRNSRPAVPPGKRLSHRRHRCGVPVKCFLWQVLPPVPGSAEGLLFKIPAVSPRPAFRQHIAGGIKGKAQPGFLVIVGTHSRNKRADFFLLVTGQLPGGHLGLRATLARSAGFYDQSPEPFAALAFLSPALLIITASPAWIVIVPAWMRGFFHHSFKGAGGKIHLVSSSFSSSISSSSHGGVSISSASSSVSSVNSSGSSYSQ